MKSTFAGISCCALALLAFSCEKKNSSLSTEPTPTSTPPTLTESAQKPTPPLAKSERGLPSSLEGAFAKLRSGAPKIPTMLKAWEDLWNGPFVEPLNDETATQSSRLSEGISKVRNEAPESLMKRLQSGRTLEGFDRGVLAGIFGLYTGWLNEPDISGQLYLLLRKRCNELPQSKGDAVLSIINEEVNAALEPPSALDEEAIAGWKQIARGRNPIYRQIGLSLFHRLTSDPTIRADFLASFLAEQDLTIKNEALTQVAALPPAFRRNILKQFKESQEANGDAAFVEKIQQIIDRPAE